MGRTFVEGTIIGSSTTKEFRFLVDTGSTFIGLRLEDIEELGLTKIPDGSVEVLTANGVAEYQTYWALGRIDGRGFGATVTESPIPLVGYEILENLRLRVDPFSGQLERAPSSELGPPYQLASMQEM